MPDPLVGSGMGSEDPYRAIVDSGDAGRRQQPLNPFRVFGEIVDYATISEFADCVEHRACGRGIELPGGGQVALQLSIQADYRRFGHRSSVPSEFNDIEKSAARVPPCDLPHGGCNFRSSPIAPSDHTLPSAFPQQRTGVFGIVLAER